MLWMLPLSRVLPVPWCVLMDGAVLEHPWQRCRFWGETEALRSAFVQLPKPWWVVWRWEQLWHTSPLSFGVSSCPLHVVPCAPQERGLLKPSSS